MSLLASSCAIAAQDVTGPALKAAYIYNFTLFTEWPTGFVPAGGPLTLCVLGDVAVGEALEREVKDRLLSGHPLTVSRLTTTGPSPFCHVLYLSGVTGGQVTQLLSGVRDSPVLTIGDLDGFTDLGGIAQLFFDRGRLQFIVRLESAKRARLQISSRLLILARLK